MTAPGCHLERSERSRAIKQDSGWRLVVIIIFFIFTLLLFLSSPCTADTGKESKNYCKDQASWQQWHELLSKHPQDDAIHALYATRRGLCSMVESGKIDLDRATRIFENMRETLIDRYREKERTEQNEEGKAM